MGLEHPVPECFSGHQLHLRVQAFDDSDDSDDSGGVRLLGAEVVEDQLSDPLISIAGRTIGR